MRRAELRVSLAYCPEALLQLLPQLHGKRAAAVARRGAAQH